MTPCEEAKQKVACIFRVLAFDQSTEWRELVSGGYGCHTALCSGVLQAHVGSDGNYSVWVGKKHGQNLLTLCAGSMAPKEHFEADRFDSDGMAAMAMGQRAHEAAPTDAEIRQMYADLQKRTVERLKV